jgi:erythromycin esterase
MTLALRATIAAALAVFMTLSCANADTSADDAAIRNAYNALQEALLKNDAPGIAAPLDPRFKARLVDGTVQDRDAFVKSETEATPGLVIKTVEISFGPIAVRGENAQDDATYTYIGTYTAKGSAKPFRGVLRATDVWIGGASGWKMSSSTVHDSLAYVGGKLVQNEREQLPPSSAVIDELKVRALILSSLALDADTSPLAPIGEAIGNAHIVGMGEGSHGTSEFFAFKDRLFKYLVEKKGFTVFALEGNWGAGLNVDRYIKGGSGTAAQAVASLQFWTWNTPEMVDLVQWTRDYNDKPGNRPKLSFAGIDMQDPMGAIGYLADYLRSQDTVTQSASQSALGCAVEAVARPKQTPSSDCRRRVAALLTRFASAPGEDAALAREAVTNIMQYLDAKGSDHGSDVRDRDMAANVEWLATTAYPHAKIALWAHNGHIGASSNELSYRTMGTYLRSRYGSDYYAIGQSFGSGTVRAIVRGHGLQVVTVPVNPADTTAALFSALHAAAFVDLRGLAVGSALQTYFSKKHHVEEIGALIDPQHPEYQLLPMVIPSSFDGLVFMPVSTSAISAGTDSAMRRTIRGGGQTWTVSGVGFDDVAVSTTTSGATLTNADGLMKRLRR